MPLSGLNSGFPPDLYNTVILIAIAGLAALAYGIRVLIWGKVHFARVDRQGGTVLLGKSLMLIAYWSLQPLGRMLAYFRVSPHVLTWLSAVFGIISAIYLAQGFFGFGAVFATVSAFLDTLDGMVARMMGVDSNTGEVLDASIDRYTEFLYLAGLLIYYHDIAILVGMTLFTLLGCFMVSYSSAKAEALGVEPPKGIMRRPERAFYLTLGAALSPMSIALWETPSEAGIMIGYPMAIALGMVGILSNISAIHRSWATVQAIQAKERAELEMAKKKLESEDSVPKPELVELHPETSLS